MSQVFYYLLIATSIPLWIMVIRALARGKSPLEPRSRIQSPIGLLDVCVMFSAWFVSQIVALGFASYFLGASIADLADLSADDEIIFLVVISVTQLTFTLVGLAVIALRYGYAPRIFGWQPEHYWKDFLIGILAFIAIAPVIMTIQLNLTRFIEYNHSTLTLLENNPTAEGIIATWLMAVIIAPITEEIFFRGILQSWLQRQKLFAFEVKPELIFGGWTRYGNAKPHSTAKSNGGMISQSYQPIMVPSDFPTQSRLAWSPVFISALFFAGVHFDQMPAPIPLFIFGLALGYVYRQTGSTLACIVMHMLLNGFTMFLMTADALYQTG